MEGYLIGLPGESRIDNGTCFVVLVGWQPPHSPPGFPPCLLYDNYAQLVPVGVLEIWPRCID